MYYREPRSPRPHDVEVLQQIAAVATGRLAHAVEANELFLDLGAAGKEMLRAQGFGFYAWGPAGGPQARFVVSWDQTQESVDALCEALMAAPVA